MKNLLLILLSIVFSTALKAEMGTFTRCEVELEYKDGKIEILYLDMLSSEIYEKYFIDQFHFKRYLFDSIQNDNEYYTTFRELKCPRTESKKKYYGNTQKELIQIDEHSILGITCVNYEIYEIGFHLILHEEELKILSDENCKCSDLEIDMEIHDVGGDSIEKICMYSNSKNTTEQIIKKEIISIKKTYNDMTSGMTYREKQNYYKSYYGKIEKNYLNKKIRLLSYYW